MGWLSSLFGNRSGPAVPEPSFFDDDGVPRLVHRRLADSKSGALPWVSTLTAPEMALARSHGLKMLAPIAATCWMHYGFSWTEGHAQGWRQALSRLQAEAAALGANAVIDTRMVTVDLSIESSMDYSLVGTAVRIEGLPPSNTPVVSTVPALGGADRRIAAEQHARGLHRARARIRAIARSRDRPGRPRRGRALPVEQRAAR